MKKISLLLSFLVISILAFSQTRVGLTAGGLLAGNSRQDDKQNYNGIITTSSYKTLTSYSAGFVASIPFGKLLALRPEILYIRKGSKINGSDNLKSWINKVIINYIELPVNVVFNAPTSIGKFYIGGGPYIAYGLNGKTVYGESGRVVTLGVGSSDPRKVIVNRMDFGVNFIGGYELRNGFFIDIRYAQGLRNVFPKDPQPNKNTVLGVSIGKLFSFKKL